MIRYAQQSYTSPRSLASEHAFTHDSYDMPPSQFSSSNTCPSNSGSSRGSARSTLTEISSCDSRSAFSPSDISVAAFRLDEFETHDLARLSRKKESRHPQNLNNDPRRRYSSGDYPRRRHVSENNPRPPYALEGFYNRPQRRYASDAFEDCPRRVYTSKDHTRQLNAPTVYQPGLVNVQQALTQPQDAAPRRVNDRSTCIIPSLEKYRWANETKQTAEDLRDISPVPTPCRATLESSKNSFSYVSHEEEKLVEDDFLYLDDILEPCYDSESSASSKVLDTHLVRENLVGAWDMTTHELPKLTGTNLELIPQEENTKKSNLNIAISTTSNEADDGMGDWRVSETDQPQFGLAPRSPGLSDQEQDDESVPSSVSSNSQYSTPEYEADLNLLYAKHMTILNLMRDVYAIFNHTWHADSKTCGTSSGQSESCNASRPSVGPSTNEDCRQAKAEPRNGKRKDGDGEDDPPDEGNGGKRVKPLSATGSTEKPRRYACPFNKRHPWKYCPNDRTGQTFRTCYRPGFETISRLKCVCIRDWPC